MKMNKYERNIAKTSIKLGEDEFVMGPIPWEHMPAFISISTKASKLKEDENPLSALSQDDFKTMFDIILESLKVNEDDDKEDELKGIITSNFSVFFEGLMDLVNKNDAGNK